MAGELIALHGLPSDPDKNVELVVYSETDRAKVAGHAATIQVGAQKSELKLLDMQGNTSTRYLAEITSLPVAPLTVYLEGDAKGTEILQKFLDSSEDRSLGINLRNEPVERDRSGSRNSLSEAVVIPPPSSESIDHIKNRVKRFMSGVIDCHVADSKKFARRFFDRPGRRFWWSIKITSAKNQ